MPNVPQAIRGVLAVVRLKWSVEILVSLGDGPQRYTDLQVTLTVSSGQPVYNRSLTDSLRLLEAKGLIEHPPAHVDASAYQFTQAGRELRELLDDLRGWGERHRTDLGL
ncbi:winged helix-turn-helix transcriptional regulator [Phytohabitans kaempferiae]|uniref:Winged helix-turn-helix transcriptional regulator n=1 Tax=Phytohabitans kaempferiae TaxID=1620943 RepID=A0ABV6MH37_9ACTN